MKSNKTKKTLISSALVLLLCFVMFLGSTFAWFTSSATTDVNSIQAGNLKIELLDAEGNSLEGKTLALKKAEGHENDTVLWEPGATYKLQPVTVKNSGNLALKYEVKVTGMTGNAKLNEVLEWEVKEIEANSTQIEKNVLLAGESKTLEISAHMKESAGNEYQGLSIDNIAITVYATQTPYEYDSTTNQYDKNADFDVEISTLEELRMLIASGCAGKIILTDDISVTYDDVEYLTDYAQTAMFIVNKDAIIDLNGHTLKYTYDEEKIGYPQAGEPQCWHGFYVDNGATLTIIDSSDDNSGMVYSDDPVGTYIVCAVGNSTVNIYGGHYHSKDGAAIYKNNAYVNIYGGKFETDNHTDQLLNEGNNFRSYGPFMLYGGSFKNFEPGVTNAVENKLAYARKTNKDGDWYNVVMDIYDLSAVSSDVTIDECGNTIVFDTDEANVFASDNSGAKVTVSNAIYTGSTQGFYLGAYTNGVYNYNTEFDNVTIKDVEVSTDITDKGEHISAGAWVYGKTCTLKGCTFTGTTTSATNCKVYDVCFVNKSNSVAENCTFGNVYVYAQAKLTLNNVKADYIKTGAIEYNNLGSLVIGAGSNIKTIEINCSDKYTPALTIEDSATVGTIVYKGDSYSQAEWLAR